MLRCNQSSGVVAKSHFSSKGMDSSAKLLRHKGHLPWAKSETIGVDELIDALTALLQNYSTDWTGPSKKLQNGDLRFIYALFIMLLIQACFKMIQASCAGVASLRKTGGQSVGRPFNNTNGSFSIIKDGYGTELSFAVGLSKPK